MKKVLSVIISLALILGSITCIFTGTASAESVWGATAKYRYEINFDNDETKNAALTQARTELLSAEGYDGRISNMIHIKEGVYKDATFLNWATTTKNTDDVFTVPVNPSSTYQISWRVKIKTETVMSETVTKKWFAFYVYNNGTGKNIADVTNAQRDTWLEYNVKFTTAADQTKLSFTFNAGGAAALDTATPEAWIDDIVIEESPYSDASKWGFYGESAQLDGSAANTASSWMKITEDTNRYNSGSDNSAIQINGHQTYVAVLLPKLEKNKVYKLSFKYFLPSGIVANAGFPDGPMKNLGIAVKGATLNTDKNNYKTTYVAEGGKMNGAANAWHEYSIEFETGENTEFIFGGHKNASTNSNSNNAGYYQLWLDDFELTTSLQEGEGEFEKLSNWILDKNAATTIGSTDASGDIAKAISTNTPAATEKSNYALELSASKLARASIKLNLEENKEYKLKFSFYSDAIGSNDSSILNMGIYAPDAENAALNWRSNPNGIYGYLGYMAYNITQYESPDTTYTNRKSIGKNTTVANYPTGQWNEVSFNFTSENYTNLYFTATIAGCTVYFDNFELVEVLPPVSINFNTNGAADMESISGSTGDTITMPANPTKDGYTFGGWYTDAELNDKFTATVYPATNTTLYAKWVDGMLQDFEEFTVATYNPDGGAVIDENSANAYSGADSLKVTDSATTARVVVAQTDAHRLDKLADFGEYVKLSFKYKLVSGSAKFYLTTSSVKSNVHALSQYTEGESKKTANGFVYKEESVSTVSNDWQTFETIYQVVTEDTFNLYNEKRIAAEETELTKAQVLGFTQMFMTPAEGTELYIDDVSLVITEAPVEPSYIVTAYNDAAALRSASNSSTGKNGLRIYNEIKSEWIESAEIVEYGSVAIRNDLLADAELTIENGRKGIAYSDGTYSDAKAATLWEENNGSYVFTAYLTNISKENYGATYLVRSYAIDKNGKVYYGDTVGIGVFKIANAMDKGNTVDGSEPSQIDIDSFKEFVTEKTKQDYVDWCSANSTATGKLFDYWYTVAE